MEVAHREHKKSLDQASSFMDEVDHMIAKHEEKMVKMLAKNKAEYEAEKANDKAEHEAEEIKNKAELEEKMAKNEVQWEEKMAKNQAELEGRIASLEEDKDMLKALAGNAKKTRMRSIDSFNRDKLKGNKFTWRTVNILEGNSVAHDGNVEIDIILYLNGNRKDYVIFEEIYGVSYETFRENYQKHDSLALLFDGHGTIMAGAAYHRKYPSETFFKAFKHFMKEVDLLLKKPGADENIKEISNPDTSFGAAWTTYVQAWNTEKDRLNIGKTRDAETYHK